MKKTYISLIALFAALQFSYAQTNTFPSSGNAGIGTTSPSSYGHGGTNKILEVYNTGTAANSQSHIILSTGATNAGSIGTITWTAPNTSGGQKEAAWIGSSLESSAGSSITSNFTFFTNNAGSMTEKVRITSNGNVGIGTTSPSAKLNISGSEYIPGTSGSAQNSNLRIGASTTNLVLDAGIATSGNPTPYSWLQSRNQATYAANYDLALNPNGGNVGIGTIDTKGYKLAVNGSAVATSMKVKMQVNWPDFVFLKDYKLPTLTEVKNYIDKNQHLPDIPSADEVHKNGLDLGEMNRLLLKKVEELTLYLIEQKETAERQTDAQQKEIDSLKAQVKGLTDLISQPKVKN